MAPEGRKRRLAKAAGAEPSGQMRDEKLHAMVVARSTFGSQNAHNTSCADHFWKLRCRKSARRCGVKHILKSKRTKHTNVGPLLEVEMSKKCTPLWREAHFQVKMHKEHQLRTTFEGSCGFARQAQGILHLAKSEQKREGFVAFPKKMAGVGHLQKICKVAFRGAGAIQETCSPEMLGGQGRFPERGCILEHQIVRFAKMILRDRCSTSYDLASLFRGRRNTLET